MKIVILGLSRFGVQLAQLLSRGGHELALIDRNPDAFERLVKNFPATLVLGIGIDQDVMRKAGVEHADWFVAATDSDNTNLMAAQLAKVVFKTPRCVARVHDEARGEVFKELGLIEVICPSLDAAAALSQSMAARTSDPTSAGGQGQVSELHAAKAQDLPLRGHGA
ncbi:MAG: TrkA family potassium uptake protein [Chloroflexi bacterium]|nr:TrkA family potassium uptake protein [Chloroflexota bacterium]